MAPSFPVVPASSTRDYEDFVPFEIDLQAAPDTKSREKLETLYAGWVSRVERATRSEARADDSDPAEAVAQLRFDRFVIRGSSARGGVARSIDVGPACEWAIAQLAKRKDVTAVRFAAVDPHEAVDTEASATTGTSGNTTPFVQLPEYAALELGGDDPIATLAFGITLLVDGPITKNAKPILAIYERFLALVGRDRFTMWGDENTRGYYRPLQSATLKLLPKWLEPGARPREYVSLRLKDGTREGAPRVRFEISSHEEGGPKEFRWIQMSVPAAWAMERLPVIETFVRESVTSLSCMAASAGLGFERSRHRKDESESHAHANVLAHPGLDVFVDRVWMARDHGEVSAGSKREIEWRRSLPGVRWLTFLGEEALGRAGTTRLERLKGVEQTKVGGGVLLKAGPRPTIEGAKLVTVANALAPLLGPVIDGSMWLNLTSGCEYTQMFVFFVRLLDWPELVPLREANAVLLKLDAAKSIKDIQSAIPAATAALDRLLTLSKECPPDRFAWAIERGVTLSRDLLGKKIANALQRLTRVVMPIDVYGGDRIKGAPRSEGDVRSMIAIHRMVIGRSDASDAWFASLSIRKEPSYVFDGALQTALDADDLAAAAEFATLALPRATNNPAVAHVLARVYARLGRVDEGVAMMKLADRRDYEDVKHLKKDAQLASLKRPTRR